MVSDEARSNRPTAHAPLMYPRYVFVWVMCCSKSVGKAWGCMLTVQYTAWWSLSSSAGFCALCLDSSERSIACPPSCRGHSRFWCYSDRHNAYGLTLSVIWLPVLITVSGSLILECNGLSQFNEDTCKPSVPAWEFNLIAYPLIKLKNPLPDLDLNPGWREPSARQPSSHCGLLTVVFKKK